MLRNLIVHSAGAFLPVITAIYGWMMIHDLEFRQILSEKWVDKYIGREYKYFRWERALIVRQCVKSTYQSTAKSRDVQGTSDRCNAVMALRFSLAKGHYGHARQIHYNGNEHRNEPREHHLAKWQPRHPIYSKWDN